MLTFQPPTIYFTVSNYIELIDWSKCKLTPPIMSNLSTQRLEKLINTNVLPKFKLMNFSCHKQSVKKIVKLVTESCTKVCGEESRFDFIRITVSQNQLCHHLTRNLNLTQCPTHLKNLKDTKNKLQSKNHSVMSYEMLQYYIHVNVYVTLLVCIMQ